MASIFYKKVAFISHFNAGIRALDIRNPYAPKEIGYYIPAVTDRTCEKESDTAPCVRVVQTNNVETDDRGYIYIVARASTGLQIVCSDTVEHQRRIENRSTDIAGLLSLTGMRSPAGPMLHGSAITSRSTQHVAVWRNA
jgi:hypothetical protein